MDLVLHVGMFKTGSTTLQQEVFPRLADLNVVGRKHPGERLDSPLSLAMESLWLGGYRRGELRSLLEERTTDRRMLVSEEVWTSPVRHETFANLTRTADRLAAEVPEAKVLLMVRRPADLLVSCYSQYVTAGGTLTWGQFVSRWDLHAFDVEAIVRLYLDRFASVEVLAFEDMASPLAFAEQLVRALGTSADVRQVAEWCSRRHNVGLSPLAGYSQLLANRSIRASYWNPDPPLPRLTSFYYRYVASALQRANEATNASSWALSRWIAARRLARAVEATNTFPYTPRSFAESSSPA